MSLLEIVVALGLIAICAGPALSMFSQQERSAQAVAERLLVVCRMRELADGLESWLILSRFARGRTVPAAPAMLGGDAGLRIEESAEVAPVAEQLGLFRIRVIARWQDATGTRAIPREEQLVRLVADPEWGGRHGGVPVPPEIEEEVETE